MRDYFEELELLLSLVFDNTYLEGQTLWCLYAMWNSTDYVLREGSRSLSTIVWSETHFAHKKLVVQVGKACLPAYRHIC